MPKIPYYLAATFIILMPIFSLVSAPTSAERLIPGWKMFSEARPLCTLRFHGDSDSSLNETHTRVLENLRNAKWLPTGPRRHGPVFDQPAAAEEFLGKVCLLREKIPHLSYDLECFENHVWESVASRREIQCP